MFQKISQRRPVGFFGFVDEKAELKKRCPEPDPYILQRLIDYYSGYDFSIRAPWQRSPGPAQYDLEELKDFARILTMLKQLGVFPPPEVQSMGGGKLPSLLPGSFDGPTQITPAGNASGRQLRTTFQQEVEMEEKKNAMSSGPGGLADGAEGRSPAVFGTASGRRQVAHMRGLWDDMEAAMSAYYDAEAAQREQERLRDERAARAQEEKEAKYQMYIEEEKRKLEKLRVEAALDEARRREAEPLSWEDFEDSGEDVAERPQRPVSAGEARNAGRWADTIRRRLPFSRRIPEEKKERIVEMLPPRAVSADGLEDDVDDDEVWDRNHPAMSEWMRHQRADGWGRYELMRRVAGVLLIPIVLSPGFLLAKTIVADVEDDLIRLFRALPASNWFKELGVVAWSTLVAVTDRRENYLVLQRVFEGVLWEAEDVELLWLIAKKLNDGSQAEALSFYVLAKHDIFYKVHNRKALEAITKSTLMLPFEFVYFCKTNAYALSTLQSYLGSIPPLPATIELLAEIKKAQASIQNEYLSLSKNENFEPLRGAFQAIIDLQKNYFSLWTREMLRLYTASDFWSYFPQESFDVFLREVQTNPAFWEEDMRAVGSFLKRFSLAPAEDEEVPPNWPEFAQRIKLDEDTGLACRRLLDAMQSYRNDQGLDQISYDALQQSFDRHMCEKPFGSYAEAIQAMELAPAMRQALFALLTALDAGVMSFLADVEADLAGGLPDFLPTVRLHNQGPAESPFPLQGQSRHLLADGAAVASTDAYAEAHARALERNLPWYRTVRYVLMKLGEGANGAVGILMDTFEKGKRAMHFITLGAMRPSDQLALPQPGDENKVGAQIWSKEIRSSAIGDYLPPRDWKMKWLEIGFSVGAILLCDHIAGGGQIVAPLMGTVSGFGSSVLAAFKTLTFTQKVIVTGVGASTIYYGPKKTLDVITGAGGGAAAIAAVAAGAGLLILLASSSNKRQRV